MTLPDVATPADTGKRLRGAGMLRSLGKVVDMDVVFLCGDSASGGSPVPSGAAVRSWSIVPYRRPTPRTAATAVLRGLPWQIAGRDWSDARAEITRLLPCGYDLVWLGTLDHFAMVGDLISGIPSVVDYDDIEPIKIRSFLSVAPRGPAGLARRAKARIESVFWHRLEKKAAQESRAVVVCSELDVERLGTPRGVAVPNTYPDPGPFVGGLRSGPPEFLMIANYGYRANVDAARFLAGSVLPALRDALPEAVLHLAGRRAEQHLRHLDELPGLRVSGTVPSVRPLLEHATAVIAAVRYGGGTRLKIIEAFAHSVPVVSTRLGAEGLDVKDGVNILLADDGEGLAAACVDIATDAALREQLARGGRRLYEAAYRPDVADRAVADLVASVLATDGAQA